jgi:radical SAM protein with 4Fe4S-binding SPASM domain
MVGITGGEATLRPDLVELVRSGMGGGLLRGNFLYCRAGVTVLGLEHDGRVVGCPVIHSSFNTQGDARTQRVVDIWRSRFQPFRDRGWLRQGGCASCNEWPLCLGGSMHNRDDSGALTRCTANVLKQGVTGFPK